MTSKNMTSNHKSFPFLLKPSGKDYLWGGTRLKTEFNKNIPLEPLAETWECSTHPDGHSIVASGMYEGMTLAEVLKSHPEYLGTHPKSKDELPILIKLIDAKTDLSIQVHPDDDYAKKYENGQSGKTEMWYVLDASPDARLVYGFHRDMTKEELENFLSEGTVEKHLQKVKIKKNDVFFINSGTVHAIGAGALIAEIQQNSNLTYRMYDYGRLDKNGNKRELHIKKALDVVELKAHSNPRQPLRVLKYHKGGATELLGRCEYFQVERHLLNTETSKDMLEFQTTYNSFKVFLCIDGCGVMFMENGKFLNFFKGDCIFVPADSVGLKFHGKAKFLGVSS